MKLQINEITLEGSDRSVSFSLGLNIITGPIASGKTTLVHDLRFLVGASLIIDGLSEHLGQEGLDPERLRAIYDLLIETSKTHSELQVIIVDNEVPEKARPFVRLELSEDDRLIRNFPK